MLPQRTSPHPLGTREAWGCDLDIPLRPSSCSPLPKPLPGPWFPQRPPLAAGLKADRSVTDGWWGRRSVF